MLPDEALVESTVAPAIMLTPVSDLLDPFVDSAVLASTIASSEADCTSESSVAAVFCAAESSVVVDAVGAGAAASSDFLHEARKRVPASKRVLLVKSLFKFMLKRKLGVY
jgi:hypothetical protein